MKAPLAVAATICALPSLMAAWMVLYGLAWPPHPVVQVLVAFTYKVTVPTARTSRVTPASARTEARTTSDVKRDRRSRERTVSFALSNLSPSGRSARQRQLRLTGFVWVDLPRNARLSRVIGHPASEAWPGIRPAGGQCFDRHDTSPPRIPSRSFPAEAIPGSRLRPARRVPVPR